MDTTPHNTSSQDDYGADTLLRYRYQITYTAIRSLDLLENEKPIIALYCEHFDDLIVELANGEFIAIQVKTRNINKGKFKSTDSEIVQSFRNFIVIEKQFPNLFSRYIIATNHSFWDLSLSYNNLRFLVNSSMSGSAINDPSLRKYFGNYIFSNDAELASQDDFRMAIIILQKLFLEPELPQIRDINHYLIGRLANVNEMSNQTYGVIEKTAEDLISLVFKKSSATFQSSLKSWIMSETPIDKLNEQKIKSKKIIYEEIIALIKKNRIVNKEVDSLNYVTPNVGFNGQATKENLAEAMINDWQSKDSPLLPNHIKVIDIIQEPTVFLINPEQFATKTKTSPRNLSTNTLLTDIINKYHQVEKWVIIGGPGSGKTTLLCYETISYANLLITGESKSLPLLISISGIINWLSKNQLSIFDYIEEWFMREGLLGSSIVYRAEADHGNIIVLADGLDEVDESDRRKACLYIESSFPINKGNRIIYSSRRVGSMGSASLIELGIDPLTLKSQKSILLKICGSELTKSLLLNMASNRSIREIIGNPMMLIVFALVAQEEFSNKKEYNNNISSIKTRASLFEAAIRILLEGRHRDFHGVKKPNLALQILSIMSNTLHQQGGDRQADLIHSSTQINAAISLAPMKLLSEWKNETLFLNDIVTNSGIIYPVDQLHRTYSYLHRTIREYLCANYYLNNPDALKENLPYLVQSQRWYGTIALLAGLQPNSEEFLEQLLSSPPDLPLAALAEVPTISSSIVVEILKLRPIRKENRKELFQLILEKINPIEELPKTLFKYANEMGNLIPRIDLYFIYEILGNFDIELGDRKSLFQSLPKFDTNYFDEICDQIGESSYWCIVPEGRFTMGSVLREADQNSWILPPHPVDLIQYNIGIVPVTNRLYEVFDPDHKKHRLDLDESDIREGDYHPVVNVTWYEARCFTLWLNIYVPGIRLPSEAEWEKAASATNSGEKLIFPWGNKWSPDRLNTWESGPNRTTEVGIYKSGRSPCGALDMAGNVWEWCNDWFAHPDELLGNDPMIRNNPQGPQNGVAKINKGGGWFHDIGKPFTFQRAPADRPEQFFMHCGFRLVYDLVIK